MEIFLGKMIMLFEIDFKIMEEGRVRKIEFGWLDVDNY